MAADRYVLDASVAVKWYLTDEVGHQPANPWLAQLLSEQTRLAVPSLFYDELGHVLVKTSAAHEPRISRIEARAVFLEILALPLETIVTTPTERERAFQLASLHSEVYYDMLCLSLAERLNCQWLTADEKVLKSSGPEFPSDRVLLLSQWAVA